MAREYGTSVETTASPDRVWKIWSDMSTWGEWNPNVSTKVSQTVEVGGLLGPVMGRSSARRSRTSSEPS